MGKLLSRSRRRRMCTYFSCLQKKSFCAPLYVSTRNSLLMSMAIWKLYKSSFMGCLCFQLDDDQLRLGYLLNGHCSESVNTQNVNSHHFLASHNIAVAGCKSD